MCCRRTVLYTTLESRAKTASKGVSCVERILTLKSRRRGCKGEWDLAINNAVVAINEPANLVK